jgi:hypothetical protein
MIARPGPLHRQVILVATTGKLYLTSPCQGNSITNGGREME